MSLGERIAFHSTDGGIEAPGKCNCQNRITMIPSSAGGRSAIKTRTYLAILSMMFKTAIYLQPCLPAFGIEKGGAPCLPVTCDSIKVGRWARRTWRQPALRHQPRCMARTRWRRRWEEGSKKEGIAQRRFVEAVCRTFVENGDSGVGKPQNGNGWNMALPIRARGAYNSESFACAKVRACGTTGS